MAVQKVMDAVKTDAELMKYLPDLTMSKKLPDRDFVFDVINTIRYDYMQSLIDKSFADRENERGLK